MKFKIKVMQEIQVKYLKAECQVRCWEDSTLNGKDDVNANMPCAEGNLWSPIINLETGQIINWEEGNEASIHYKICDQGNYYLLDDNQQVVTSVEGNYVIDMMSPREKGWGDYVIMDIDKDGLIDKWKVDLDDFEHQSEE